MSLFAEVSVAKALLEQIACGREAGRSTRPALAGERAPLRRRRPDARLRSR